MLDLGNSCAVCALVRREEGWRQPEEKQCGGEYQNQDIKGNGQVESLGTQRNRHSTETGNELIYLTMRRGQQ